MPDVDRITRKAKAHVWIDRELCSRAGRELLGTGVLPLPVGIALREHHKDPDRDRHDEQQANDTSEDTRAKGDRTVLRGLLLRFSPLGLLLRESHRELALGPLMLVARLPVEDRA